MASRYLSSEKVHTFFSNYTKEIFIGRDKNCHIQLDWDKTYSKIQCCLLWDSDVEQFKLIDGGEKGPSRNGTWILAHRSIELEEGMSFRVLNSKILVKMKQQTGSL